MSRSAEAQGYTSEDDGVRGASTAPGHIVVNGDHHLKEETENERVKTAQTEQVPVSRLTTPSEPPGTRQTNRTHFTTVPYGDVPPTRQTVRTEFSESTVNGYAVPSTSQTNRTTFTNVDGRPGSSKSVRSIPDSDFYAQKKRDKDPTSRWESSYSRPSTSQSVRFDLGNGQTVLPNGTPAESSGVGMTDDFKSSSRKSERKPVYDPEPEIMNGYESDPRDTLMPSEYVYGMGAGDKFDGRKMGLSSQTFDAALASMLEREEQNAYDYDNYARTGGVPQTNSRKARVQSPYYTTPYPLGSGQQPRNVRQGRSPVRKARTQERGGWSRERGSRERVSRDRSGGSRERHQYWSDDEAMLESLLRAQQQQERQSRNRSRDRSKSWDRSGARISQDDSDLDVWHNSRNNRTWGPEARVRINVYI